VNGFEGAAVALDDEAVARIGADVAVDGGDPVWLFDPIAPAPSPFDCWPSFLTLREPLGGPLLARPAAYSQAAPYSGQFEQVGRSPEHLSLRERQDMHAVGALGRCGIPPGPGPGPCVEDIIQCVGKIVEVYS